MHVTISERRQFSIGEGLRVCRLLSFYCFFADMRMSTSMYEIFNWTDGSGPSAISIPSTPAQVTRSNSSSFGIYFFSISSCMSASFIFLFL